MGNDEFIEKCQKLILDYIKNGLDKSGAPVKARLPYVVWSVKVLQNNKALLSTDLPDGMYYEITYDGTRNKFYFDAYKKWENIEYDGDHAEGLWDKGIANAD
jgi:hypothetical protein